MDRQQRRLARIAPRLRSLFVLAMLALITVQVLVTIREDSVTWDEGDHLYSGYQSLTHFDFGFNPEHPPLPKYVAALPLLGLDLVVPPDKHRDFKTEAFLDGRDFLSTNFHQNILFRARLCVASFLLLLALVVYRLTEEMFGWGPACLALALVSFDPNLLAHGGFVATDIAFSCTFLLSLYGLWRYVRKPTIVRAVIAGGAVGLALASKHTGLLLLPISAVVLFIDCLLQERHAYDRLARRYALGFAVMCAVSVALLWTSYGFRYAARPHGQPLNPTFASYVGDLHPGPERSLLLLFGRFHLLPEAYLYGIADVQKVDESYTAYFFGKVYPHGVPLYFPAVLLIKSTLPFLLLLATTGVLVATGRFRRWRELSLLAIPPAVYLAVAMASHMNIGARHILPMYPPLYVLAPGAVWPLAQSRRWGAAMVGTLVAWQIWGTVRILPSEIAFANELWGGPSQVHRYLGDSNVDWGQQLIATSRYIREHGIRQCWIVYFPQGVVDTDVYDIPCKPLPTANTLFWLNQYHPTPEWVDGPVFISDGDLESIEFGPPALNPYEQFKNVKQTAVIQYGMSVFDGHFHLPLAAALSEAQLSSQLLQRGDKDGALKAAQKAVSLASESAATGIALAQAWAQTGHHEKAADEYRRALGIASTVEPQFELPWKDEATAGLRSENEIRGHP